MPVRLRDSDRPGNLGDSVQPPCSVCCTFLMSLFWLQVPIRVVYLDRTAMPGEGGSSAVATYDFIPDGCAGAAPRVHLLYRPGHYDVLYPAASA